MKGETPIKEWKEALIRGDLTKRDKQLIAQASIAFKNRSMLQEVIKHTDPRQEDILQTIRSTKDTEIITLLQKQYQIKV